MERMKVLIASTPFDGEFNPLTTLALALKEIGYDVRWYTHENYAPRLVELQIPHFPFKNVLQFHGGNINEIFPRRAAIKNRIARLSFDIREFFVKRGPEYYQDLKQIHTIFPFDVMIADLKFTGIPFVRRLMDIPVIGVNVFPLVESANELIPYGMGKTPGRNLLEQIKLSVIRFFASTIIFRQTYKLSRDILASYGINGMGNIFDDNINHSSYVLQSGTPGFEYFRRVMSGHIRFAGAILPTTLENSREIRLSADTRYERTILVSHGTAEKDIEKLLVPTLEAFRGTNTKVIVTTGGVGTEELRERFPESNFLIEDFIVFSEVMPYCDVFVSNGGYGGVLLAIQNELPMVVAGVQEGRNEICARVGYFKVGINLQTERPSSFQIRNAVDQVMADQTYAQHVIKLAEEFSLYDPRFLVKKFVYMLTRNVRTQLEAA